MKRSDLASLLSRNISIRKIAALRDTSYTNVRYWIKKHGLSAAAQKRGRRCACGETDPLKFYHTPRSTCIACHNRYSTKRQKENKAWAVVLLGGKCSRCGYSKCIDALEFHHCDPTSKNRTLNRFAIRRSWSRKRIEKEIRKCKLVCRNCHAEIHAELHAHVAQMERAHAS